MGNGLSPCSCTPAVHGEEMEARLVFWGGGPARVVAAGGRRSATAGDVMAELPDHVVCAADCFFIGLPIPALPPCERLLPGRTYFVLPAARFSCRQVLTAASLASLSPAPAKVSLAGASSPFEYVTGDDGMALIRVLPDFIEKVITCGGAGAGKSKRGAVAPEQLCSTPELRKHYMQLVGVRQQRPWSPGLETISEAGRRRSRMTSPVRLVGLATKA